MFSHILNYSNEKLLLQVHIHRKSCETLDNADYIGLLKGAQELELYNLVDAIGNYLIAQKDDWIKQNILAVYQCASSIDALQHLLKHCNQLMASSPDIVLTSNNLAALPKEMLISLLKNDELVMDEG